MLVDYYLYNYDLQFQSLNCICVSQTLVQTSLGDRNVLSLTYESVRKKMPRGVM